ncbi:peptidase inhibitor family I36 protein [Virgisporangium aurantiacum]|uniref:Peptidase inhibitor family I36 n=1 Tax=Virgisporangium aurantiacum TaxID=175570 RepID=A0A8J4E295_9ACTN|nr:peptidase inhibitor family I36 protein [Virgisporangium aurantiacum]GIJ56802.1 hypothetical protein Vau01_043180 [Virgisporangium aurantiacum]
MRKKTLMALMFSATLAVSAAVSPMAAAHASEAPQDAGSAGIAMKISTKGLADCPIDHICVWENTNFSGRMGAFPPVFTGECRTFSIGYLSAYNRTVWRERLWRSSSCTGGNVIIYPGGQLILANRSYSVGAWP